MLEVFVIAGLAFYWITASMVCALYEASFVGSEEFNVIKNLMESKIFTSDDVLGKIVGVFSPELWSGVLKMATFNYSIFHGDYEYVRWILFMPIAVGIVYALGVQVFRLIRGGG